MYIDRKELANELNKLEEYIDSDEFGAGMLEVICHLRRVYNIPENANEE